MPFLAWVPTAGSAPTPLPVTLGGTGSATAAAGLAALGGQGLQAATAVAGYTLVNGTGNVLTWNVPNDGLLHRVTVNAQKHITSTETGGSVTLAFTNPDGSVPAAPTIFAGGQSGTVNSLVSRFVQAGTTITLAQATALTAGASVMWADFWGF